MKSRQMSERREISTNFRRTLFEIAAVVLIRKVRSILCCILISQFKALSQSLKTHHD